MMPTLFKQSQESNRQIDNDNKRLYQEKRIQIENLLKALTSLLANNPSSPAQQLIATLPVYIQKIPETLPLKEATQQYAQEKMDFIIEFINTVNTCLQASSDTKGCWQAFFSKTQSYSISTAGDFISNQFIYRQENAGLYLLGAMILTVGLGGSAFLCFYIACALCTLINTAATFLMGFCLGLVSEMLGMIVMSPAIIFGCHLMHIARSSIEPAESNEMILKREKEERLELCEYAKQLLQLMDPSKTNSGYDAISEYHPLLALYANDSSVRLP
ncbi:MAG TPA: hypothetical protein VHD33_06550 [Legionellaceae bacterium]|nr:hypothetical protein [Legionellaceae bacterium]